MLVQHLDGKDALGHFRTNSHQVKMARCQGCLLVASRVPAVLKTVRTWGRGLAHMITDLSVSALQQAPPLPIDWQKFL